MSKQTHEYQFCEFIKDIGFVNEMAEEGWRVHTLGENASDAPYKTYEILFEREVD